MPRERIRLGPDVLDLAALGVRDAAELLATDGASGLRGVVVERDGPATRIRCPLAPRGAAAGEVVLSRFQGGGAGELLVARLTAPRSASLAEREWNLICHLRAHGVGTPEPLAVGARGGGLVARRSFLLTRALAGFESLPAWLERGPGPVALGRGLSALGSALARLFRSGVDLPGLDADGIFLSIEGDGAGGAAPCLAGDGLRGNRMPAVALDGFRRGRIRGRAHLARRGELLAILHRDTRRFRHLGWRARGRVFLLALRGEDRRAVGRLWRQLVSHGAGEAAVY